MNYGVRSISGGLIFAILWGSASTATKKALQYSQPFTISVCRFFLAALILLAIAHLIFRQPLPTKAQLRKLMIYGLLNITIYLGFFIIGMQYVSAGIASLFIATNPVFISMIAAIWLKQRIRVSTVFSLLICSAGILVAAFPLLQTSYVTPLGLIIILLSMLSYSAASLYFSKQSWEGLHIFTINGWQTFFGGIFTLPFFFYFLDPDKNSFSATMLLSVAWLALPVSIGAVMLWMYLLKENAVRASFWLFLCPVFGIFIAAFSLGEPLTLYTAAGVALVLAGLYIVQRYKTVKTTKAEVVQASQ